MAMDLVDIPLPPIQRKNGETRKERNVEDQQKAEEFCFLLRQACIERIKPIEEWKPNRDKEIIKMTSMPLPCNFDTSIAYAKLRKDFRERDWVVRHVTWGPSLLEGESLFEIYPAIL